MADLFRVVLRFECFSVKLIDYSENGVIFLVYVCTCLLSKDYPGSEIHENNKVLHFFCRFNGIISPKKTQLDRQVLVLYLSICIFCHFILPLYNLFEANIVYFTSHHYIYLITEMESNKIHLLKLLY